MPKRKPIFSSAKAKKRRLFLRLAAIVACLLILGWVWFIVESRPAPVKQPGQHVLPPDPKEYCSDISGLCMTLPGTWFSLSLPDSPLLSVSSPGDKAHILYLPDIDVKPSSCDPKVCMVVINSAEPHPAISDALLVRGVLVRTEHDVHVPMIFVIAQSDLPHDVAAGQIVGLKAEFDPTFQAKGRVLKSSLQAVSYTPGNYASIELAQGWFKTQSAQEAYNAIRDLSISTP